MNPSNFGELRDKITKWDYLAEEMVNISNKYSIN